MNKNIVQFDKIYQVVPKTAIDKSNEELKKIRTEWCFKKYSINNKIFVTINFKLPDSDKIFYIDENGERIIFELGNEYDEFIVEQKYWYAI